MLRVTLDARTEASAEGTAVASTERADVVGDERGAILVLGIFMCVGLAGMLWYLAGIGDAIVYRERMQEAADATAFSGAVLLARGMNLIVFLNLIMACILAVRVALKVMLVISTVLAIVFGILSAVPIIGGGFAAGAYFFKTTATTMNNLINATRSPINNAIKALNQVETVLGYVIPPAAAVGSGQVGLKYKPMVTFAASGGPALLSGGLPIKDDTPDVLCGHAGAMVGEMIWSIVSFGDNIFPPGWKGKFENLFASIAKKGSQFFCETGSGGGAPDFSAEMNSLNSAACSDKGKNLDQDAHNKENAYHAKCIEYQADCSDYFPLTPPGAKSGDLTPAQQTELESLKSEASLARQEADAFSQKQCEKEQNEKTSKDMKDSMKSSGGNTSAGGKDLKPKKVDPDWYNGAAKGQVLSIATGDKSSLNRSPKIVQLGAWLQQGYTFKVPEMTSLAVAQGEFFYNCEEKWGGPGNKCLSDEPMWNFRWRARIHRFNFAESKGANTIAGIAFGAEAIVQGIGALTGLSNLTWNNGQLRYKLVKAMEHPIIH